MPESSHIRMQIALRYLRTSIILGRSKSSTQFLSLFCATTQKREKRELNNKKL